MKKSLSKYFLTSFFVCMLLSFIIPSTIFGFVPDYNGGVHNEYTYEEYVFISGTPVYFLGGATITEQESNNKITRTYRFNLTNSSDDKLTRNITYVTDLSERKEKGQTTAQTSVTNYSETITIGERTYTLDDLQFSHGTVIDNRPASDYYSGNIVARKIYITDDEERITVHVNGKVVGFSNFWGTTETQILDFEIQSTYRERGQELVKSKVSNSKNKFLQYEKHDPSLSSFTGGYAVISQQDMIGEYTFRDSSGTTLVRNVSQKMTPKVERLIVPKFRDLAGHWARDNIERLYSLGVLDEASQFFSPNTPMTRYQFTTGVIKAADIRVVIEEPAKTNTTNNNARNTRDVPTSTRQQPKGIFSDLDPRDENYKYVVGAVQKGIIEGVNSSQFRPNDTLTRAQAVTILVRALGLENRAPTPGFRTNYADNNRIPQWAMDSVYVATEIGLVRGDQQNRFNPNQPMSRGEAATMLIRFLDFLEKDLKQNYRDDMLFFN